MRIGFDATSLAPATRYTGMGEYTARLLAALGRRRDPDTYVVYSAAGCPRPDGLGPAMRWVPLPRVPLGKLSAQVAHRLLLPALVRRHRLDVLHIPTVNIFASHPPVPYPLPCRLVVTLHDLIPLTYYRLRQPSGEPWPWKMRAAYRANLWAASHADRIITVSQAARDDILTCMRLPPRRVAAIHNGMDFGGAPDADDQCVLARLGVQRPYALFGGSWEPRKNLARMLHAFAIAAAEGLDHDLVLIVDGPPSSGVPACDAVRPRLRFLHGLPEDDLRALYRQADVFVFPSLSEGFGFPPLQAMACGVPVVASAIPALREVLGDAACYVDPRDVRSIAAGMLAAAGDAGLRDRLRTAGPRQAARYNWDDTARRTREVYAAAVECPPALPGG
jgi:glycosyltransferase involved in cell wall biosynthesis